MSRAAVPLRFLLGFCVAYFFVIGGYFFLGAGRDDLFITCWSALQLAAGKGLVNYNWVPCEISSSLLHVLCLAGIYAATGWHYFVVIKYFGAIVGLFTVILGILAIRNFWQAALFAIFVLANQSFMYWSFGGLESSLVALCLFAYCLALTWAFKEARWLWANIAGMLTIIARPEGFIVILISATAYSTWRILLHEKPSNGAWLHIGLLVVSFAGLTLLRLNLFDLAFPVPVYAKSDLSLNAMWNGVDYVVNWFLRPWNFLGLAGTTLSACYIAYGLWHRNLQAEPLVFGITVAGYFGFIVFSGADWMEYGRFVSHIAPCMALLSAYTITRLINKRFLKYVFVGSCLLTAVSLNCVSLELGNSASPNPYLLTIYSPREIMMLNEDHRGSLSSIAHYIADQFPEDYQNREANCTIYSYQAGFFAFMLRRRHPEKKFRFIDTAGLTEPMFAHSALPKSPGGLQAAGDFTEMLDGKREQLSACIFLAPPTIFYCLPHWPKQAALLARRGFRISWQEGLKAILVAN